MIGNLVYCWDNSLIYRNKLNLVLLILVYHRCAAFRNYISTVAFTCSFWWSYCQSALYTNHKIKVCRAETEYPQIYRVYFHCVKQTLIEGVEINARLPADEFTYGTPRPFPSYLGKKGSGVVHNTQILGDPVTDEGHNRTILGSFFLL